MPSPQEQLEQQVEKSIELTQKMLDRQDGLQTQIKALEENGKGAADLKEQVSKMAGDNAKAIDEIKRLTEEVRADVHKRQDEWEAKFGKVPGGDGAALDVAAPIIKAMPREVRKDMARLDFNESVKAEIPLKAWLFKVVTSLAASAGDAQIPVYEPTLIAPGQQPVSLLNFLPRTTTESPLIYWVIEVLGSRVNNTGIQSLDFTGTGQGTALGLSDFVFDQKSAQTRTFGHRAKIAVQILDDVGQLRGYLENQMRYMVEFDLEDQILNGDGTGNNIAGLKNVATAYDATLDNDVGVTAIQNLDVIRLAILQTALTFFPATGVILNSKDAAGLELIKDGQDNYIWANPTLGNMLRPWGVPVVATTSQVEGDFTVGAFNQVEVVVRKAVEVMVSTENEDDFNKLLATMRAYGRFGLKVYQPGSIIDGDFTTAKAP